MKLQFYGPINQGDVIRKAVPHLFLMDTGAQGDSDKLLETITVQPDPLTAIGMPDSDFGFSTEIDLAFDSA